ncbi:MAG: hypothetical protein A2231_01780 [Candidatus Firestonebacteria bacterium RIFOXYA2_FULL_40_8]|nr:MAG: hypothetical protein A2231_01780 [Candidatus Firestonebacteria bacterium RIFOXYA2_FULL_40_8]
MAVERYIAFDFGAGSGRAVLGELTQENKLNLSELHRFSNASVELNKTLYWNTLSQYTEIKNGLRKFAAEYKKAPKAVGIDTWGVDFGFIDNKGKLIDNSVSYRDKRTDNLPEKFFKLLTREKLYGLTGIQIMQINTVFQLFALSLSKDRALKTAKSLLFTPDLLNYFLTGEKAAEFTISTTSQLYNPVSRRFEKKIFEKLGVDINLMQKIVLPGKKIERILPEICSDTNLPFGVPVIAVASHDTASAIAAIPAVSDNFVYISSGSWSLIGFETDKPCINENSVKFNYTNEGGVDGTFRVLKNINGLWLIQEIKRMLDKKREHSFVELTKLAEKAKPFTAVIDPNYPGFLSPKDMIKEIQSYCLKTGQAVPKDEGSIVRTVLESLALAYRRAIEEIIVLKGKKPDCIHIIGGGSNNRLLNRFTAEATGLNVFAGPSEATSAGNILVQAMGMGRLKSLKEIREVSKKSFTPEEYVPGNSGRFDEAYKVFLKIT